MAAVKITWQAFLNLVASYCEIKGAPKSAFLKTFESCDPAISSGCQPLTLKVGSRDYNNHTKQMTTVYKKLRGHMKFNIPFANSAKSSLVLLWQEYKEQRIIKWESNNNNAQRLDGFLRDFNYQDQLNQVVNEICGSSVTKVILVPVDGDFTKRWLVKRLASKVPNHEQSNGFSIIAKPNWKHPEKGLMYFWESLFRVTKKISNEPKEIIQEMQNWCTDRPLIMAIHDVQILDVATLRKILTVFWEPLIERISNQKWTNDHGDCILFLTTDLNSNLNIKSISPSYGVDVKPWLLLPAEKCVSS